MPEGLRIRAMAAEDLDAVMELDRGSEGAPHWSRAEYLGCLGESDNPALHRYGLVAELPGNVAGFAVLRVLDAVRGVLLKDRRMIPDAGAEAELESIVVAGGWRRRGIGEALLAEIEGLAKRCGAGWLELEVRASNAAAVRLYERSGLVEIGRRPGYYRHPEEEAVLMRVIL